MCCDRLPHSPWRTSRRRRRQPTSADFPATPRLKILLVEDDEADANLIREILEANPRVREVLLAEDGVKALELVRCGWFNPDLAVD